MGGDLNADYEFSKAEVENLHRKLKSQQNITKSLTSPDQISAAHKYEKELEKELGDWEGERDSLKHQVEKLKQENAVADAAAMIPGEGMVVSAAIKADVAKKSKRRSSKSPPELPELQEVIGNVPSARMERDMAGRFEEQDKNREASVEKWKNTASEKGEKSDVLENVETQPEPQSKPVSRRPASRTKSKSPEPEPEPESEPEPSSTSYSSSSSYSSGGTEGAVGSVGGSSGSSSKPPGLFRRFFNSANRRDPNAGPPKRGWVEFIILLAIVFHLIDFFKFDFSMDNSVLLIRFTMYFVISVLVVWKLNKGWNLLDSIISVFRVSIFPALLFPIIYALLVNFGVPSDILGYVRTAVLMVPFWPLYLVYFRGFRYESKAKTQLGKFFSGLVTPSKLVYAYFTLLVLVVIFKALMLLSAALYVVSDAPGVAGITGAADNTWSAKGSLVQAGTLITSTTSKFLESVKGIGTGGIKAYKKWENDTLGTYYSGQVEQNKEATGIFITEFKATGVAYDSIPLTAYGLVKARSFGNETNITFNCYAQQAGNKSAPIIQGLTDPPHMSVYREDQIGVMCTFAQDKDHMEVPTLSKGHYTVWFELNFDFETWGYVEYYFMDTDFYTALTRKGTNPNTYFGVPTATKTVYTSGPVKIGMSNTLSMPFLLSSKTEKTMPIGLTIENQPTISGGKGEIMAVNSISLIVPEQFDLAVCTTHKADGVPDIVPGYKRYVFDNSANVNNNLKGAFQTVTCNTKISAKNSEILLRRVDSVNGVTIAGVTSYKYNLSKQISVEVLPTP